jgi:threonine dehydrogenase-like Zn-dependent dehydrogenase
VDWTPLWFREITVSGSYAGAMENYQGRSMSTAEVGLELMANGKVDLAPLLTHRYPLEAYSQAFRTLSSKADNQALKVVFTYD